GGIAGAVLACLGLDPRDPAPLGLRVMRAAGAAALLAAVGFVGFHAARDVRRRARVGGGRAA
ncbi:MAG TPA: hypothetical protein VFP65_27305, partial [Anaeromyxobacteraceae bacterium]|nr:hypothetical protein [Anaeromyxobacteraceae bacterium]